MTYPHVNQEAFDAAFEPAEIVYSNDVYGQIEFDIWFCVLQKGVGKLVYDPGQHNIKQRRTAVTVNLNDIGGNNYKREFIAEIPADGWSGVTLPSLKALGVAKLADLNGAFVHAEMTKYGSYTKSDGTEGIRTAPKVLRIFKDLDECAAAAQGGATQADWLDTPAANGSPANGFPVNGNGGPATNAAEKQVAMAFLPAIVKSAVRGNGVDSAALTQSLKDNPILAKYFNIGSPEVIQAIEAALADPAF